jgi:hypothetical protein
VFDQRHSQLIAWVVWSRWFSAARQEGLSIELPLQMLGPPTIRTSPLRRPGTDDRSAQLSSNKKAKDPNGDHRGRSSRREKTIKGEKEGAKKRQDQLEKENAKRALKVIEKTLAGIEMQRDLLEAQTSR